MKIVDVTLPLSNRLPVWPGSLGFKLNWTKSISKGNENNNSSFFCDAHTGTHIDAPYHFLSAGKTIDQIPLNTLIGSCRVISIANRPYLNLETLKSIHLKEDTKRLLFKTDNSKQWLTDKHHFNENFVHLTENAAKWLASRNLLVVGIDYLSVGGFRNGIETHKYLLEAGIVIVEGLDLSQVDEGDYELICLPLKVMGAEAAPARAILISIS